MKMRYVCVVALFVVACATASAAPAKRDGLVPLDEATKPWLQMLRSGEPSVRSAATAVLMDIVRKHPSTANDVVRSMAAEGNGGVAAEYERCLVPLAKESPVTVSVLIRLIRERETHYRARNFAVKVLSQVGPAAATPEFVDALGETYCPVPGAFQRVMRAMGKDAAPILIAGYRHPNETVRKWSTIGLRNIGRTEPTIQKVFDGLQAEPRLLQKVREGTPAERIEAIGALAELARMLPGAGTALVHAMKDITDKSVRDEAERRLIALGRESPEVVAALLAGIRSRDNNRLRGLAFKVLSKVGHGLNCAATVEALGDQYCPVPGMMRRILLTAGADALPVLGVAQQHANHEIREAAGRILQAMPRPAATAPQR